jgi:hypothetical protein
MKTKYRILEIFTFFSTPHFKVIEKNKSKITSCLKFEILFMGKFHQGNIKEIFLLII